MTDGARFIGVELGTRAPRLSRFCASSENPELA